MARGEQFAKCKHCGRQIDKTIHLDGEYRGKQRCDPLDTKKGYGYNAEPEGTACKLPCLGAPLIYADPKLRRAHG